MNDKFRYKIIDSNVKKLKLLSACKEVYPTLPLRTDYF